MINKNVRQIRQNLTHLGNGGEYDALLQFFERKENLMKRFFILILIFVMALTACDALTSPTEAPTAAPTNVPPTAEVVVVTVEVPVEVTAQPTEAPPTAVPTETLPPTPTEVAPSATHRGS